MAEKPSLGDDTTLQKSSAPGHWPGHWPSADNPTAAYHKTTAADGPVVVNLGDTGVVPPGYRVTTGTCKIIPQPMDDQRDDVDMSADTAVTLMKEAVASSIKHNDIQHDAVAKAVGMSRQQLREWIDSRIPNPQWDTKLAGWLQGVQRRATSCAIEELHEP